MDLALVVLAAGIGSRYGGVKQMDSVGPSGERLPDYGAYDAIRAGFNHIVFVVSADLRKEFEEIIGAHVGSRAKVSYVVQDVSSLPPGREKPWGTGHALLSATPVIETPFTMMNADDFYGRSSYQAAADFLAATADRNDLHALVSFVLRNTLSPHGSVCRGVCVAGPDGRLRSIEECTDISRQGDAIMSGSRSLTGEEPVSTNLWAFKPSFLAYLQTRFEAFLAESGDDLKAEFFLPDAVGAMIREGRGEVKVLRSDADCYGVTRREDKEAVVKHIASLVSAGEYPTDLWEGETT